MAAEAAALVVASGCAGGAGSVAGGSSATGAGAGPAGSTGTSSLTGFASTCSAGGVGCGGPLVVRELIHRRAAAR
jgi:hypothetical protein